jgi:hypothetical protein
MAVLTGLGMSSSTLARLLIDCQLQRRNRRCLNPSSTCQAMHSTQPRHLDFFAGSPITLSANSITDFSMRKFAEDFIWLYPWFCTFCISCTPLLPNPSRSYPAIEQLVIGGQHGYTLSAIHPTSYIALPIICSATAHHTWRMHLSDSSLLPTISLFPSCFSIA